MLGDVVKMAKLLLVMKKTRYIPKTSDHSMTLLLQKLRQKQLEYASSFLKDEEVSKWLGH